MNVFQGDDVGIFGRSDKRPHDQNFELCSDGVNLLDDLWGQDRNAQTAMRDDVDKTLGFKFPDNFSGKRATDPEALAE